MAEAAKTEQPQNDDTTGHEAKQEIKNLKAEFDRKLSNIEKTNQALLNQLQAISQPKQAEPKKESQPQIKEIWYDDPERAAKIIVENTKKDIYGDLQKQQAEQSKKNTVIQQLYREYPELQDFDHPLTTKAVELFDKLSEDEKSHPMAYRLAVKEAADELEIRPKAKRKDQSDDSFSLSGIGEKGMRMPKKKDQLDPRTIEFGRLVGLDVDNEKVITSLKERAQRSNWNRWE